jgi:CRP/FNR family transcriptional regulator, anaerobic regulatory protein
MSQIKDTDAVVQLLEYFNKVIPLNAAEQKLVMNSFIPRRFRKKQMVLHEGEVCTQFYFVAEGCLRMFKVYEKGLTHVLQFSAESQWILDLGSFHGLQPSELNIDALEDTLVLQINRDDLIALYLQAPKFDRIFRVLLENSYVLLQERLLQTISTSAEERYQRFLNGYPHLVHRLSQIQIASYLGITPEFLSRLRNRASSSARSTKS